MSLGTDLVARARSLAGRFYYTNDWWARIHPWESGGTDCSGFCKLVYEEFGYDIGTWTGDESQSGTEVARGHYPSEIPWDIMQPGDLIFMTATYWNNYNFDQYLCHVEIYCGGGTMIGHPSGYGPTEKWAQAWMEAYGCITWKVMRIFEEEDDMSATEVRDAVLGFKNPNMYVRETDENVDTWQHIWNASHQTTRTDNAGWKTPMGHDIFGRVNHVEEMCMEMQEKLDDLTVGKVDAKVEIDYGKLADAVADKLAQRMAD